MTKQKQTALVKSTMGQGGIDIRSFDDVDRLGSALCESGFFKGSRNLAQAVIAIEYGLELGIPPVAAVMNIHIVEGKATMSANMVAARIRSSSRYDYRTREHTAERCVVDALLDGEVIGTETFTIEDARRARLSFKTRSGDDGMWTKYPRNMLFARTITNLARFHFPDLFLGGVYTAEEIAMGDHREVDDVIAAVVIDQTEDMPDDVTPDEPTVDLSYDLRDLEAIVAAMSFCEERAELNALKPRIDSEALTDEDADLVRFYWGYVARRVDGNHKAAADYLKLDGHAAKWEQVEELIPGAVVEEEEPPARAPAAPVEAAPVEAAPVEAAAPVDGAETFVDCPEFVPDLRNEGDCMRCGQPINRHRPRTEEPASTYSPKPGDVIPGPTHVAPDFPGRADIVDDDLPF